MIRSFPGAESAIHYSDPCSMSAPTKHNEIQITANFSPVCPANHDQGHGFGHLHKSCTTTNGKTNYDILHKKEILKTFLISMIFESI